MTLAGLAVGAGPGSAPSGGGAVGTRPRVVYLDHVAQLSGAELALLRLLPAMTDVDVHVILGEDGPLAGKLRQAGVSCEVLPIAPRTARLRKELVHHRLPLRAVVDTVRYGARLARRLRELRPVLVHTNSMKAHLYGGVAGRLAGVPVVWHLRDRVTPEYLPLAAVRLMWVSARILPAALVANSESTLQTLGRVRCPRLVLPSPVLEDAARDGPAPAGAAGVPFTVGVVGRLAPWKGQDVFLRAFATAFPAGEERAVVVGAAMFGETAFANALPGLAEELGIGGRVEFRGFVDDVGAELRRLDVLVHCSTVAEPFGQVVIEGMAAGLPVIASDAGGPAEIVRHRVTGLLTPMGDVDALAAALQSLAGDRTFAQRIGAAAKREVSGRFLAAPISRRLIIFYRDILGRRRNVTRLSVSGPLRSHSVKRCGSR